MADDHIVSLVEKDDLVITADIPLAAEVIEKQAKALNPRGELYTAQIFALDSICATLWTLCDQVVLMWVADRLH